MGTSRLSGGYRVEVGNHTFTNWGGETYTDAENQIMDISLFKKFKIIQELYPEVWSELQKRY